MVMMAAKLPATEIKRQRGSRRTVRRCQIPALRAGTVVAGRVTCTMVLSGPRVALTSICNDIIEILREILP